MKKSIKAVLLSAFLFPGAGHIYLKKYMTGCGLIGASFAAMYCLISNALEKAIQISEEIQSGDMPLDVEAITELVSKQSTGAEAQLLNFAAIAFIICWIIVIIDSYRVGRARDSNAEVRVNRQT